jgi:phosphoribosylglycinamide formyltransferase 1
MTTTGLNKRIAVLISGKGSNLEAIMKAIEEGKLAATIAIVISNKEDAGGLKIAEEAKIPTEFINHKLYAKRLDFEMAIHRELVKNKVEFVVLAGFMRMFTSWFCDRWVNRMINIHPSLLPAYKGLDTHQRAIDEGTKIHGCTVHFVVHDMDAGPIIAQSALPMIYGEKAEDLAERVLALEHALYPPCIALLISGRLKVERNSVRTGIKANGTLTVF